MKHAITASVFSLALALIASQASAQAAGTYKLMRVGDDALPAVVEEEEGCREQVDEASLTLHANGTWKLMAMGKETCGSKVENEHETDSGKYTMSGKTIRFIEDDDDNGKADDDDEMDDMMEGTLDGEMLNIRVGGAGGKVFAFRKQ